MSRIPIRNFLERAKSTLQQSLRDKTAISFVIGNESADLDSIACALVYGYIQSRKAASQSTRRPIIPVANIPASDLRLRPELSALLKYADIRPADLVTLDDLDGLESTLTAEQTDWTLVDHNAFQGALGQAFATRVVGVVDHHADEDVVPATASPRIISKTGSCSSHVVNFCRKAWDTLSGTNPSKKIEDGEGSVAADSTGDILAWDAEVAQLALGPILIDTVNLTAEDKTTDHDREAVEYLERKIKNSFDKSQSYNRDQFFQDINDAKSDLDDLSLDDILRKDYKQWEDSDISLGISSCVQPIEYLESKSEDLGSHIVDFARDRQLQIYAIMTAHNSSGRFQRQLLLVSLEEGKPFEAVKLFTTDHSEELQLKENKTNPVTGDDGVPFSKFWEQSNLSASRKQLAPLLRKAIKNSSANM